MASGAIYDQAYIKQHNIQRVLDVLEVCRTLSRTDLARLTEMSATSITRIVGSLIALGLVREVSVSASPGRGRRAIMLEKRHDGLFSAGIHLDTESLEFCLIDFGNCVHYTARARVSGKGVTPSDLSRVARALVGEMPMDATLKWKRVRALGVSVSGMVDYRSGVVMRSDHLGFVDANLEKQFSDEFLLPVRVENDVKACLTGEKMRFGIPEEQDSAYLYIGRAGIGAAFTANKRLVRGKDNTSGEVENTPLSGEDTLDRHLMSRFLIERAKRAEPRVSSVQDILEAYRLNLSWARVLIGDFLSHMRLLIRMIDSLLNPHQIILGGETIRDFDELMGDLLNERVFLGHDYYETCAYGVAIIAMREAVEALLNDEQSG